MTNRPWSSLVSGHFLLPIFPATMAYNILFHSPKDKIGHGIDLFNCFVWPSLYAKKKKRANKNIFLKNPYLRLYSVN